MLIDNRYPFVLRLAPWGVLLAGLVLTDALQDSARASARHALQEEFDFRVNEILQNIDRRMHNYEQVLDGTAGLFAASGLVEREEFSAYVRALKLEGKYPGIQGLGFAKLVLPEDKDRHVAQVRAQGFPDYRMHPAGVRECGCDEAQGYLFSRPVPAEQFSGLIEHGLRKPS